MADIFISYSKIDHALALKLSTFLEAEGWTVWWDKSLAAADLYRDEIMKQLAAARAVISIWTPNSVKSDWVRAEAGRAKAEGKLIPVKTADVAYPDIPLPFGEMHTENVSSTDLIRGAIVAQLAKPSVPQTPFWQITKTFKYQLLTWIGIVGSAITLFANLEGVLNLAYWAKVLVSHWHEWAQMFWGWVFSLIKIRVPRGLVPTISFTVFALMLVVGGNLSLRVATKQIRSRNTHEMMVKTSALVAGVLLYPALTVAATALVVLIGVGLILVVDSVTGSQFWATGNDFGYLFPMAVLSVLSLFAIGFPIVHLLYFVKERQLVWVTSLLFLCVSVCLLLVPFWDGYDGTPEYVFLFSGQLIVFQVCWMVVVLFSPLQHLARRLGFVVLGVVTLVGLSEISKLNLHQYLQPAKVSDSSVR
jgi:TIR domain